MPNRTRCDIHGCHTIPSVLYALTANITKVLCRRHQLELELRGRRPMDVMAMEKRAKEGI